MTSVLDSSAVLAVLRDEPGAEIAAPHLRTAVISAVNAAEVVSKLIDKGYSPRRAEEIWRGLEVIVEPFDAAQAVQAGVLRKDTASLGLSLADRACLALAHRTGAAVLTTDRAWARLSIDVEVQLIR